jgi:hypothetical protein
MTTALEKYYQTLNSYARQRPHYVAFCKLPEWEKERISDLVMLFRDAVEQKQMKRGQKRYFSLDMALETIYCLGKWLALR